MEGKKIYPDFNRESKLLGIIDYKSIIILLIYSIIIWNVTGLFLESTFAKIYIIIIMTIPLFCLFYINIHEINTTYVVYTIIKYVFSPKLYIYKINELGTKQGFINLTSSKGLQLVVKEFKKWYNVKNKRW